MTRSNLDFNSLVSESRSIHNAYNMLGLLFTNGAYCVADREQVSKAIITDVEKQKYDLAVYHLMILKDFLETEPFFRKVQRECTPNEEWTPKNLIRRIEKFIDDIKLFADNLARIDDF